MNVYIAKPALVALNRDTELRKILRCMSEYLGTVYTDLTPRELMIRMREDDPLCELAKEDVKISSSPELFSRIAREYSAVLDDPSALYILNISENTAKRIQQQYGVFCRSYTNPDMDFLLNGKRNKTTAHAKTKSWDEFFDSIKREYIEPINTVFISDRYLFQDTVGAYDNGWIFKAGKGVANCIAIINNLLPNNISTTVSILVCFDANSYLLGVNSKEYRDKDPIQASKALFIYLSKTIYSLISLLSQEKGYTINLEMVAIGQKDTAYPRTHNRRVITNYAELYTEQNLAAFTIDKASNCSMPTVSQHIDYKTLFAAGVIDDDDCPIISHVEKINDFISIFDNWNKFRYHSLNGELSQGIIKTQNAILRSAFRRRKIQQNQ